MNWGDWIAGFAVGWTLSYVVTWWFLVRPYRKMVVEQIAYAREELSRTAARLARLKRLEESVARLHVEGGDR